MDKQTPETWIDDYGDTLYSFAIVRVNNQTIAEDLVQETFLAALKGLKDFQGKSSIKTWLISILKRKIIDHYRKKSTSHEKFSEDISFNEGDNTPFQTEGIYAGAWKRERMPNSFSENIEEKIESEEFQNALLKCLSLLPPKWSACFSSKMIDEQENEEICKNLQISTSNLWVMLHRARLQLRECLEKNWLGA